MKRVLIATVGIVAVSLGTIAWAATAGGARDARPALRIVAETPLTIRGVNFEPAEHVSVTARDSAKTRAPAVRALRAGSAGGFLVRFPEVDANACQGFSVLAVGSDGSRAAIGRKPGVCPPPAPVER